MIKTMKEPTMILTLKYLIVCNIIGVNLSFEKIDNRCTTPLSDNFDPNADAVSLHTAMNRNNTTTIINVLAYRDRDQRIQIAEKFKKMYGKNLISDLKSELSSNFEGGIVVLMTPMPENYAKTVKKTVEDKQSSDILEVLMALNPDEVENISNAYVKIYGHSLQQFLETRIYGNFGEVINSMVYAPRYNDSKVDNAAAAADARKLYEAGEGKLGTDESTFLEILTKRSYSQLRKIFEKYERIYMGNTIENAIESEFSYFTKEAYLTLVQCVKDKPAYFARKLHLGLTTETDGYKILIRIIVTLPKNDLSDVLEAYQDIYDKSLVEDIKDKTSGDYKRLLLALIDQ